MCVILHPFRHQAPTGQTGKKNENSNTNSKDRQDPRAGCSSWQQQPQETCRTTQELQRPRNRRAGTARDLCDRSCRPRSLIARPTRLWRGRPALRRKVQTQERTHMDQAHGSPFDRGSADSFYRRQAIPHYMINGARIEQADMTAQQIAEYEAGFLDNEKQTDSRKDYA